MVIKKRTEAKRILGIEPLNKTHLTFADVIASVIVFGDINAMTEIV